MRSRCVDVCCAEQHAIWTVSLVTSCKKAWTSTAIQLVARVDHLPKHIDLAPMLLLYPDLEPPHHFKIDSLAQECLHVVDQESEAYIANSALVEKMIGDPAHLSLGHVAVQNVKQTFQTLLTSVCSRHTEHEEMLVGHEADSLLPYQSDGRDHLEEAAKHDRKGSQASETSFCLRHTLQTSCASSSL